MNHDVHISGFVWLVNQQESDAAIFGLNES
jgi:hypothetical protein